MTKSELFYISKKYYIAGSISAYEINNREISAFCLPAFSYENSNINSFDNVEYFSVYQDTDALYIQFFDGFGNIIYKIKSAYTVNDYIYIREAFYLSDNKIKYFTDFNAKYKKSPYKVTSGRFMPKKYARNFLHIKNVKVLPLSELTESELKNLGFDSLFDFADFYDSSLSEKQFEYAESAYNPYIFYYEFEVIDY